MKIYLNAYIAQNLGDDLFLDMLLKRYSNHEFYAITQIKNNYSYPNLHLYHNPFLYKFLKKFRLEKYIANRFDMVVTIGGSMFIENPNTSYDLSMGKKDRYILGINVGPYETKEYYTAVQNAFRKCKDVCFREKYSYHLFQDLPNVRLAPDIAFGLDTSHLTITNRKRAIISVISCDYKLKENHNHDGILLASTYESKMVEFIERLIKEEYEIVLLSMCKSQGDSEAVNCIFDKCNQKLQDKIQKYEYQGNIEEALNLFADSSLIVGSRLHANIIGLALGKTIIPLVYSDKTIHILEDILENSVSEKPLIVDIRNIEQWDVPAIKKEDLTRIIPIGDTRIQAQEHFKKLDEVLL